MSVFEVQQPCVEEAAKAKIPFYVLDRPNPITGTRVEGR